MAAGPALSLNQLLVPLLLLLWTDQLRALSSNTRLMTAVRGGGVTFPGGPKRDPDSIEWTYSRAAGSKSTSICNWYRNNAVDCTAAYGRRVQLHLNGSLTIRDLRIADSGWYHLTIVYGWSDFYKKNIRLQIRASASRTDPVQLFLIHGLFLFKYILW